MGGYNSGRHSGRPTIESGLMLDINLLLRKRHIRPGQHVSGSLTWSNTRTGEETASIGYEANLVSPEAAWARLHYTVNGTPKDYRVWIEASACNYGGERWWWICPLSGRRVVKLCLPPGATLFAARGAYRLAYSSQREGPMDRTRARQARLYRKLGVEYDHYEQPPPSRPKGMHFRTYKRLEAELYAAMDAHDEAFIAGASAIIARGEKMEARRR